MRKRIGTFAALIAAAMAVIVVPASPAWAASPPLPPLGPGVVLVGRQCAGTLVPRCVELRYDTVNLRYRAWGAILDNQDDGTNYDVDVRDVFIGGIGMELVGYHGVSDTLSSDLFNCPKPKRTINVTYTAIFKWRNASTGNTDGQTLGGAANVCS